MAFRKINPADRKDYLYKCDTCGDEQLYSVKLLNHLLLCKTNYARFMASQCKGKLVFVKEVPYKG